MTSILTNTAAMAALQTLRSIDGQMETTQGRVSSGLRVGTAADNAAYWSIATTMRSDNAALSAVQDALGLGAAKVDTAYAAMESVVDVVEEIKAKLVAATEAGVDKSKIQEEITQLQEQLKSVSESASFSGENWLQADLTDGPVTKSVVGSFVRDSAGNVSVQKIDFVLDSTTVLFDTTTNAIKTGILDATAKLSERMSSVEVTVAKPVTVTGEALTAGGATLSVMDGGFEVYTTSGGDTYVRQNLPNYEADGTTVAGYAPALDAEGRDLWVKVAYGAAAPAAPDEKPANAASVGATAVPYAVTATDVDPTTGAAYGAAGNFYIVTQPAIEKHTVASTTAAALAKLDEEDDNITVTGTGAVRTITTAVPAGVEHYVKLGADDIWVKATQEATGTTYNAAGEKAALDDGAFAYFIAKDNLTAPGDLETDLGFSVHNLDITQLDAIAAKIGPDATEEDVLARMVQFIDEQLEAVVSATSTLGSISMRIELQEEFAQNLTDSIDSGIGRLVDADMNEESTRLKALQTQQQLAVQALSIANTSSENILTLFR